MWLQVQQLTPGHRLTIGFMACDISMKTSPATKLSVLSRVQRNTCSHSCVQCRDGSSSTPSPSSVPGSSCGRKVTAHSPTRATPNKRFVPRQCFLILVTCLVNDVTGPVIFFVVVISWEATISKQLDIFFIVW